ncbi:hypothetical protein [Spirillospora albida]|uniref:hypothetical protein n=1 Tax=Spirillospora albida TaxID=58123 RepID=UPI0004C0AEC5|nr:hypothetical protein [Spirillospora albida]
MPRPSEPFQRVYSAPEPPAAARRPRRLALLVAVVAFAVAAVAAFLIAPGRGNAPAPRTSRAPETGRALETTPAPETSSGAPEPSPTGQRLVQALPAPCGAVRKGTARRVVPGARERQSQNSTLTTCTYASTASAWRWLRVEAHLYAPANTPSPVEDAEGYYDAQWAQARGSTLERTITLARHTGLGDESFRWFKADRGQPTVVGQMTFRERNAVVTVSYSEQASGDGAERRREACLANAEQVAREVLAALR